MQNTIFALASGNDISALSVIRISGKECKKVLKELTLKKLPKERVLTLRNFYFPRTKKIIDRCLVVWMACPRSYTGEDSIEIHSHGGEAVFRSFFQALTSFPKLRYAEQGEFSKRAIINGKTDLVQAEAINDLINSQTEKQRELAISQYNKGLSVPVKRWRKEIINCMALIEANIDFSDENDTPDNLNIKKELTKLKIEIKDILKNKDYHELVNEGIRVVFKGRPNAGKSSIFNSILKKQKAIVSKIPGTTRDIIEGKINFNGNAITFYDTAGIVSTDDYVEKEGIRRTKKLLKEADIILNIAENEKFLPSNYKKNEWLILNKIDINKKLKKKLKNRAILVSAKTGVGLQNLLDKISDEIIKRTKKVNTKKNIIVNLRQANELKEAEKNIKKAIQETSEEIIGEHLREANRSLERIIGNIDIEEVLGNIFSSFCIGK
ncbi:MAG: tRNA uridine-5-carboxymethylaminomethyl(34) synthesis GTPase MnmE [Alphaproteobacteria bacterium TMED62]|nr:MAG: tRNA uridine-5-carboxymethylaminomethyl(34) synthesis GTPase MnmE [Alphaproteobacteria bacterium TMED62]|tara:strand:- start:14411 stop:15721 length:1311 start_codon:yes stop_codon:yes gene_type:complete